VADVQLAGGVVRDCSSCGEPDRFCRRCPVERGVQPRITAEIAYYLRLARRAVLYHALPDVGGLEDQDETVMRILDVIAEQTSAAHEEHRKAQERKETLKAKLRRGFRRLLP
jgi:hypothetical protein